ncbi:MAG: hypothetical protein GY948_22280 [Alphaproteobacteria bacterium]|nr:hypothetical protein [Alphaproteobacteria bacterium]
MKTTSICIALLLALPAAAEEIISPDEFEALSTGKTLYFTQDGRRFGAEQFYTRRRSLWQFNGGECADGVWYDVGDMICFEYDGNPDIQCWHFIKTDNGFVARPDGGSPDADITMSSIDAEPLDCKGPSVGA